MMNRNEFAKNVANENDLLNRNIGSVLKHVENVNRDIANFEEHNN